MTTAPHSGLRRNLPLWEATLPVLEPRPAPAPPGRTPPTADFHVPGDDGSRPETPSTPPSAGPQQLLDEARREAERILEEAREQAACAVREATRQARAETAGHQTEAFAQIIEIIRADLAAQLQEALRSLEHDAARLCAALAETVIRRKIAADDDVVLEVVREGLSRMVGARDITLRVSPAMQERLEAARDTLAGDLPGAVALTIIPDESVSAGGAILQSANGEIDLRIETQMARLREAADAALTREGEQEGEP